MQHFLSSLARLTGTCCRVEVDGDVHLVTCWVTGAEMIWSPEEPGSREVAVAEHNRAHFQASLLSFATTPVPRLW